MSAVRTIKHLYPQQTAEFNERICNRLKYLMEQKGMTPSELAEKLSVHKNVASKWFSGEHNFYISTLFAIGKVLGQSVIEIPSCEELIET